jgi:hypothetical protein
VACHSVYTKQYAFTELEVKCTKSGRTRKSKWDQYGKCARKGIQDMLRSETPVSAHPLEPQSQAPHSQFSYNLYHIFKYAKQPHAWRGLGMQRPLSHLRKHKLRSHNWAGSGWHRRSGDNSTGILDSLLRTCDWSRTWPSEACRLQKAFGESSKKAILDSESFSTWTELCGCIGDELYVLPEYRDHLMSVQST